MLTTHKSVLGLDVGAKRIGVSIVTLAARLPRPLTTLERNEAFFDELAKIIHSEDTGVLVVGLPRNLQGQGTEQTEATRSFIEQLRAHTSLPIHEQDEAVTSAQAEAELQQRGKPYVKGDIDALAATYILEDWLHEHPEGKA